MRKYYAPDTIHDIVLTHSFIFFSFSVTLQDCGKQLASKGGSEKCYPIERHLYCRECNAARVYQWYKMNSDYQQEPGLIV